MKFRRLKESNYNWSSSKLASIKNMITKKWGKPNPSVGPTFITPEGEFIEIYPELDDHEDLIYWLEDQGIDNLPPDAEWFVDELCFVRCRDSMDLCFIQIPKELTTEQKYAIQEWMEAEVKTENIEIILPDGSSKIYNTDDYFPDDIIKLINRYYSSGVLYEQLEVSSKAVQKTIDDRFELSDSPVSGPTFITRDGKFIDINNSWDDDSIEDFPCHGEIQSYLYSKGLVDKAGQYDDGSPYLRDVLGYIRCNDIEDENNYIELFNIRPTTSQYCALQDWFDTNSRHYDHVVITTPEMKDFIDYNYNEYIPEDLIKKIKRYYSSGVLYESLKIYKQYPIPTDNPKIKIH